MWDEVSEQKILGGAKELERYLTTESQTAGAKNVFHNEKKIFLLMLTPLCV